MNQIEIGKFIADERKAKKYAQRELADKLGISDKTISKWEWEAGAFECPECHERFVPDMKSYIMGPHTITKRKLTCPKCGCTKYCKHVLTK